MGTMHFVSSTIILTLVSLIVVSSLGLVGSFTLSWNEEKLRRSMPKLIAIAAGVLIGEAVFHLIPESVSGGMSAYRTALFVLVGVLASLLMEFASRFKANRSKINPVARISLVSESLHNAVDGAIIAGAYLIGPKVGLFATLAIAVHEIPHELGNYAILIHAGYERFKALKLNLISACCALVGGVVVLATHRGSVPQTAWVLPFAAGCFLYMAIVDLVPSLWHNQRSQSRIATGYGVTAGLAVMLLLAHSH